MNFAELFKKNFILIPVVASILVGTFTSIRYVLNLTSTIDDSKITIIKLENDLSLAQKEITDMNTRLSSAEATWQMAENLYRFVLVPRITNILRLIEIGALSCSPTSGGFADQHEAGRVALALGAVRADR